MTKASTLRQSKNSDRQTFINPYGDIKKDDSIWNSKSMTNVGIITPMSHRSSFVDNLLTQGANSIKDLSKRNSNDYEKHAYT